ncbi:MAG: glycosyltransferase family 2 protein [Anaerolineae bacterium]
MSKHFLTLITRCRDEPFLEEFVNHYFHEGVDHIYLIDDNLNFEMPDSILNDQRVSVIKARSWTDENNNFQYAQMLDVNLLFEKIRDESEWFLSVDADEFITTKKNPDRTIRDELLTTFKDVDCVKIPWVMMSSGGRDKDPSSLLHETVFRWNHDRRHPVAVWGKGSCKYEMIEVKCVFKPENVVFVSTHYPIEFEGAKFAVVDSVQGRPAPLNSVHLDLRNKDIEVGYLLCYHYRIMSKESAIRKINASQKLKGHGGYSSYSSEMIMAYDYAEILDETLKLKSQKRS